MLLPFCICFNNSFINNDNLSELFFIILWSFKNFINILSLFSISFEFL